MIDDDDDDSPSSEKWGGDVVDDVRLDGTTREVSTHSRQDLLESTMGVLARTQHSTAEILRDHHLLARQQLSSSHSLRGTVTLLSILQAATGVGVLYLIVTR